MIDKVERKGIVAGERVVHASTIVRYGNCLATTRKRYKHVLIRIRTWIVIHGTGWCYLIDPSYTRCFTSCISILIDEFEREGSIICKGISRAYSIICYRHIRFVKTDCCHHIRIRCSTWNITNTSCYCSFIDSRNAHSGASQIMHMIVEAYRFSSICSVDLCEDGSRSCPTSSCWFSYSFVGSQNYFHVLIR